MTDRTLRISARMAEEIQQWASDELSQWPRDTAYAADLENLLSQLTAAAPAPDPVARLWHAARLGLDMARANDLTNTAETIMEAMNAVECTCKGSDEMCPCQNRRPAPDTKSIRDLIADTATQDTTGLTEEQARIVACDRNRLVSSLAHEWRAHTVALLAENERLRTALAFYTVSDNWCIGGPLDGNSPSYTGGPAIAALAQKEGE